MILTPKQSVRYWAKVQIPDEYPCGRGCWEWVGNKNPAGYGRIKLNGKMWLSHRVSWGIANGRWPELCVLHSCDNPGCVQPEHLREGSHSDSMNDMYSKGRGRIVSARGGKHGRAKLTEAQVMEIRADPRAQHVIGSDYGVSQPAVSLIKRRIKWSHLA